MDLLARCKERDPRAQRELVDGRATQVYRWAVLLGLGPGDAEDVTQEVLAIAIRRIDSCEASAALTSWLYQITRRVVANMRRLAWWRRAFVVADPERPAFCHASASGAEEELDLRRCLGRLPRKQVEVLLLVEVEGFTQKEVAELLGLPPGTVASRLRLARAALRARWEEGLSRPAPAQLSWREP